jgi:3-methylfumaryl-CoA hydratase
LFCFSAVTWNPHRIHYDLTYTREKEHLADLVVPGPMQGAWLMQIASRAASSWAGRLHSFSYRNSKIAYVGQTLTMTGTVVSADATEAVLDLWIETADGTRTCEGTAGLRREPASRQPDTSTSRANSAGGA